MLIRFSVKNFRSIRDNVELSLKKTSLRELKTNTFQSGNNKLIKSAVIYGPNASGKSGLLRAFKALEYLIRGSSFFKPDEKIASYEPLLILCGGVTEYLYAKSLQSELPRIVI
jgi:hypothetical protein